jgi:hypothetical protein
MIETALLTLKYLGMVLSGVFGAFGLLVKFKDGDGRITRAGRAALILICFSTLVAVGSQSLELLMRRQERISASEQRSKETLAAVQRTEKTLFEISRSLYPIKDIFISYWVSVPSDHVSMRNYINRFDEEMKTVVSQLNEGRDVQGITGGMMDKARNYRAFSFSGASPLAPKRKSEKLAYTVFGYSGVELQFFKNAIKPSEHPRISVNGHSRPDLSLSVSAGLDDQGLSGGHTIAYRLSSGSFEFEAHDIRADPLYWESTGDIISIPDLLGSQMYVTVHDNMVSGDPSVDRFLPEIRRKFELGTLVLKIGGQEFWFRKKGFQKYKDRNDYPIYVFNFPKTLEELKRLML